MSEMEKFFTRKIANDGIKVPLSLPSGEETEHYFIVRGVDSDAFRNADARARRMALVISEIEDKQEKEKMIQESHLDIIVSLIAGWSFEEECTPDNVRKLLIEAPQLADAVDKIAAKRSLFFGERSRHLRNTQKSNSSSADLQKGQSKA
jgi:hypothetical protein